VATLSPEDRAELEGHVQVFLAEKKFEGCAGLELDDEIRVTIAAQACLLLLHRETDYFPDLEVILVYPHTYVARTSTRFGGGLAVDDQQARLGQSASGVVVLAWDAVRRGATDVHDGHNVTLHEFAHQLDQEDGVADGAPVLGKRAMYTAWARVLGAEFAQLVDDVDKHRRSDIDEYGATNPAEFFAVVTEMFFEKPVALQHRHPALYEQLSLFYRQDPAAKGVHRG
jgi:Mlc titration factor MtfA (ptsG expression regulator)